MAAALRGPIGISRLSSASVAGVGECDEVPAAGAVGCGGRSRYYPSLQVQRTSPGAGPEFTVVCGTAYPPGGCAAAAGAITYKPWPFAGPQPGGVAAVDPSNPPFPWSGLLPDARREPRCTATVGGATFRTARCPTNAYGFTVDLGALPALPGGMLSVRRATNQVPGANPGGTQEIVLLTNASALAGPLTVHSDLPVYIAGNFNTAFRGAWNGPPPANIHAPRIVLLPNETSAQLATSAVWDSVARSGSAVPTADPLRAESNVTVYAFLRTGYCRSGGGAYFGGAWEGAPAVLGDWSGVGLRIIGAVEVHDATVDAPGCGAYAAAWNAGAPSGTPTTQPSSRTLLMDDRLLHPAFQPPGSWSHPNVPSAGSSAIPGRTQERQVRASGGTTVVRRTGAAARGLPEVPAAVPLPPLPVLPAAPLPLP